MASPLLEAPRGEMLEGVVVGAPGVWVEVEEGGEEQVVGSGQEVLQMECTGQLASNPILEVCTFYCTLNLTCVRILEVLFKFDAIPQAVPTPWVPV